MAADLDPRVERSRRVIAESALQEMADVGYGAMTVEGIARRAGVSKATIYRHWSGKLGIIESALELLKATMPFDETVPPRARVTQLVRWLAEYVSDQSALGAACLPAMVSAAEHDPAVRDFHHRFSADRRQVVVDMVVEGQMAGEIETAIDPVLAAELLVGPIFYRRLMTGSRFPSADVDRLIETVLGPTPA